MIKLGVQVVDHITRFQGIAVSRTEYLFGCVRVGVEPQQLQGGKPGDVQYFDEQRLEEYPTAISGGPGDAPPSLAVPIMQDPR